MTAATNNPNHNTNLILKKLLANEFVLYTKTRKAHWNVYGPNFYSLHKFFEVVYQELDEIVDSVAERIRTLGDFATGTLEEFKTTSVLAEIPGSHEKAPELIKQLLTDNETIIAFLKENIVVVQNEYNDLGTTDFLTGILQQHEKTCWMLRVQLES